jgi:hypothetical protein
MNIINFGDEVIDIVTNFKGITQSKNIMFNGNIRWEVRPKTKKGDTILHDGYYIDELQLKVIKKNVVKRPNVDYEINNFNIGDKVKIITSGEVGVIVSFIEYFNKCVFFEIELIINKETKLITEPVSKLKMIKRGPRNKKSEKTTGGPISKSTNYKAIRN